MQALELDGSGSSSPDPSRSNRGRRAAPVRTSERPDRVRLLSIGPDDAAGTCAHEIGVAYAQRLEAEERLDEAGDPP